jgi:protein TilB
MKVITRELLRKRAEHNEGMISTLEEISLHQEELLAINEVLGASCRKLKILYLQNNCIAKMENLVHLKDLVYLNMALNNVEKIEGLQNCEHLAKLDLTANFVDVDELAASMDNLSTREHLAELYMMGNPCQANWKGFESYVIGKIPQLKSLDGKEITRSMQITARQQLPALETELRPLAEQKLAEKELKRAEKQNQHDKTSIADAKDSGTVDVSECVDVEDDDGEGISDRDKLTENTPETRYEVNIF